MNMIQLSNGTLAFYPPENPLPGAPAIVICPGGAYATRSGFEGETVARYFAGRGFAAYVCEYSVGPEARMPRPLLQLAAAVAKAREQSGFVAVCGFSAGGHLCAMLCTAWQGLGASLGCPDAAIRPDAAVLGYPPTYYPGHMPLQLPEAFGAVDGTEGAYGIPEYFRPALRDTPDGPRLDFEALSAAYLTGSPHPDAETLHSLSPALRVNADTPPAFVWSNATDPLVPCEHSIRYAQALREHGVRFALHLFSQGGHGEGLAEDNPESRVWPEMAVQFLLSVRAGA